MDPKQTAEASVGQVRWETLTWGFCRCPGEAHHTSPTGPKDCRVHIDGAPTIHCFHSHCHDAVAQANLRLRQALASEEWMLALPDGRVLKGGETLTGPRSIFRRSNSALLSRITNTVRERGETIFDTYCWPYEQIIAESPLLVASRDPLDQFRLWLRLWPLNSTIWMGHVHDSGPEHVGHFRPISDWHQIGPAMGCYTCPSSFRPGSSSRCEASVEQRQFLVVESDTLSRDDVGAVFQWLSTELGYRLRCVIDTGGKSLHGWFEPPPPKHEPKLKAALTALGCDPKLFTRSQPVRVPGAYRENQLQRLLWLGLPGNQKP